MKLYRSLPLVIGQPDVYHSRKHLDFGKGFYLTTLHEQAWKYAMRFLLKGRKSYINKYLRDDELSEHTVKEFKRYDVEWLDYVRKCRKGMHDNPYGMVMESIADDTVFNTIDFYFFRAMS